MPENRVHSVKTAAERAIRHEKTILRALRNGDLIGHQNERGGPWRIFENDLDAWIKGRRPGTRRRRGNA
ncbi:helix-turn-helix domain-containing protein [Actinosynnema sp. NPDC004786]